MLSFSPLLFKFSMWKHFLSYFYTGYIVFAIFVCCVFIFNTVVDPVFPLRVASTYDFAKFSQKLYEIEKILTEGRPSRPP